MCETLKLSHKISDILLIDIVLRGDCKFLALEFGWDLGANVLPELAILCVLEFAGDNMSAPYFLRLNDDTFTSTSLNDLEISVQGGRKVESITFVVCTGTSRVPYLSFGYEKPSRCALYYSHFFQISSVTCLHILYKMSSILLLFTEFNTSTA